MRFVCTLFPLDTLIVSVFPCVLGLVYVCLTVRERWGNHINNQPHNENDPQRTSAHTPAVIEVFGSG